MENGQLALETIDTVAPRLRQFVADLIDRLRALRMDIQTTASYLLNSSSHPIEVIAQANNTTVQMSFTASLPGWAEEPRARLEVKFNYGKSRKFYERADKTFNLVKVVKTFIEEIHSGDQVYEERLELERKQSLAESDFMRMSEELGIPPEPTDPYTLKRGNLRFRCVPGTPTKVLVLALVTHAQAVEISNQFLEVKAPPKKNLRDPTQE